MFDDDEFDIGDLDDEDRWEPVEDPRENIWLFEEEMARQDEWIDRNLRVVENELKGLERTKEPDESWAQTVIDSAHETEGLVDNAFKIEYKEAVGNAQGTFTGPGLKKDWEPEDEMAWIQGNPNNPLSANFEFNYDRTEPNIYDRAVSAFEPNRVEISFTGPETGETYTVTLDQEVGLTYSVEGTGWINTEESYEDFRALASALDALGVHTVTEEAEDRRDPEKNRPIDDFYANINYDVDGAAHLVDFEASEDSAERIIVPSSDLRADIGDHSYSNAVSELRDRGYSVDLSAENIVSTETEEAVITGPERSVYVGEDDVSMHRSLEPENGRYSEQSLRTELEQMESQVNAITGNHLTDSKWELKPVNVIKPSQEQEF